MKGIKSHSQPIEHHLKMPPLAGMTSQSDDDTQSPPLSPLRLPQLSPSSISSWTSSSQASQSSDDGECNIGSSKEDRSTYNTKFAKHHLETYRQNDKIRWNFDFDHNRPLEESHHHHNHTAARYQWEPAT